jgi:hypothetical protein
MVLPTAMGAVVDGTVVTCQIPLSGHFSPVRAVVPRGLRTLVANVLTFRAVRAEPFRPCTRSPCQLCVTLRRRTLAGYARESAEQATPATRWTGTRRPSFSRVFVCTE